MKVRGQQRVMRNTTAIGAQMAFLTPAQLAKAQAEAEGFQNGPQPALNPANIYTQDMAGNPITPSTGLTPYYPSSETPNLQLSTRDMASELANNFCIIDSLLVGYAPGANVPVISQKLQVLNATRSEERRVGKECRSRWS